MGSNSHRGDAFVNVVDLRDIDFVKEGLIVSLWSNGLDTWGIARKVGCRECQVYNMLARMKEGKR